MQLGELDNRDLVMRECKYAYNIYNYSYKWQTYK